MKKHVKKFMILVATVVIICAISIVASAETYGDLEYEIVNDEVTITGVVDGVKGDVYIPDTIDGYTVTGIGEYAFLHNKEIENMYFPDTIKYLGENFFLGSDINFHIKDMKKWYDVEYQLISSFQSIGGEDFKFYYDGKLIEDLVIPYGITEIKDCAFWCFHHQLKNVEIPDTVERIGEWAFFSCYNLKSVNIPDSVKYISRFAFNSTGLNGDIIIPDSVEYIGEGAFNACYNIKNVYILNPECVIDDVDMDVFSHNTEIHSHAGFAVEEFANRNGYNFKSMHYINGEWVDSDGKEINNSCEYCKKLQKESPLDYFLLMITDILNAIVRFFESFKIKT